MAHKLYLILSGVIFFLVGVLHFFRLLYGWPIVVGPRTVPYALSYVGCPASFGYSVWAAWLLRRLMKRQRAE
ncbi:MAG: hypothetical protein MUO25_03550 [Thermoanaerobaculaceae bacterium]|nr:hypothetical protein [Thermoanaerobaculaceae bacterium]